MGAGTRSVSSDVDWLVGRLDLLQSTASLLHQKSSDQLGMRICVMDFRELFPGLCTPLVLYFWGVWETQCVSLR